MNVPPDWLIADRVRRLQRLIILLARTPKGIGGRRLLTELRASLGGPRQELLMLVDLLETIRLLNVSRHAGEIKIVKLNRKGLRISTLNEGNARRALAELLIQSGLLHAQVRVFLKHISNTFTDDIEMVKAPLAPLRHSAPQLLGLLRAWPNIVGSSFIKIPRSIFLMIDTPWSLIPLPTIDQGENKVIGSRAEAYSYHYLRLQSASPSDVTWVAQDDEGLGYDIEDRSTGFIRIEVKASRREQIRFYFSNNECKEAHKDPASYRVHFWGDINIHRDPNNEYIELTKKGFPIILTDIKAHLSDGRLEAIPVKYLVKSP